MKWETVTSTIGNSVYTLWNNGKKLVTLAFNPMSSAARIESGDEKRVFLIRKEGFLKNKTIMRNEYGVRIGSAGSENNASFIELNDERFFYELDKDGESSVKIYKDSRENPIAVCELGIPHNDTGGEIKSSAPMSDQAHYSMLMALCWYLFKPANRVEYSL